LLTRFVGLSLFGAASLCLLLSRQRPWQRRLKDLATFAAISLSPFALWILRNLLLAGSWTDRTLKWNPVPLELLQSGLSKILLWFAPGRVVQGREWILAILGFGLIISLGLYHLARRRKDQAKTRSPSLPSLPLILTLYLLFYLITVLLGRAFFDPRVPLDSRLLSPAHHILLLLLISGLASAWKAGGRLVKTLSWALAASYLAFYGFRAFKLTQVLYQFGFGYQNRGWRNSEGIQFARQHEDIPIYSNASAAVYFWTGRVTAPIGDLTAMRAEMHQDCAVVIVFDSIPLSLYHVSQVQLGEGMLSRRYNDSEVYLSPACDPFL
jgi:hypothetical protein